MNPESTINLSTFSESQIKLIDWLLDQDLRTIRNLDELDVAIALQIAAIDRQLVLIVRRVLHCPSFQRLESSFRSIHQLVQHTGAVDDAIRNLPAGRQVNIFVLDISADELQSDLEANSHQQTWVYDKLYRKRFDFLIGEQNIDLQGAAAIFPFSLMLVDFDFGLKESSTHSGNQQKQQISLGAIRKLARIGESCFCMFLLSVAPDFFGDSFTSFGQLENVIDVRALTRQSRFDQWHEFRQTDSSRMIGLALPRVLVRKPYRNHHLGPATAPDGTRVPATGIRFDEHDGFGEKETILWGRASFAVAQPLIRSFKLYDWFSDVSGIDRDPDHLPASGEDAELGYDGGLIDRLPKLSFSTDSKNVANYSPVELTISEANEAIFSSLGLIPVFSIHQSPYVATLSFQSVQLPKEMSTADASANVRLSSMFNYMLCVCRMAHRLKIECRSQIGKTVGPEEVQSHMQKWLMQHSSGQNRRFQQKRMKPFYDRQTRFKVQEDITDPGRYNCTIQLCPHHKYDSGSTQLIFEPVSLQMQLNANEDAK